MSTRTRLIRTTLSLFFSTGIILMLWPLGQSAFGWWNQRALHADWQRATAASAPLNSESQNKSSNNQKPLLAQKIKPQRPERKAKTPAISRTSLSSAGKKTPGRKAKTPKKPAPASWVPTRIVIPEINVDAIVVQGTDESALRRGPGHEPDSALPGQAGNCVIAAHRNVYGAWFADLDQLWAGSVIELHTPRKTFTYHVLTSIEVSETDVSVLYHDAHEPLSRLTLITCTLPASSYRHIVSAELIED